MRNVEGKTAIVTGAGTGVGASVAVSLAQIRMKVGLVGRRADKLERTASRIADEGGVCEVIAADISDPADVARLYRAAKKALGPASVLVNNAGVHCEMVPIAESTPERWIETLMINTAGPYLTSRAFMGDMVAARWGRIFNISSAASIGAPGNVGSVYQLSKVALNHFTRQLAVELAGTGVTANAVHPGEVMTEMWAAIRKESERTGNDAARRWVDMVAETGGDPPIKTATLIMEMLSREKDDVNGEFLWIKDGIQEPRPAWQ